jgi:hypothetical protein
VNPTEKNIPALPGLQITPAMVRRTFRRFHIKLNDVIDEASIFAVWLGRRYPPRACRGAPVEPNQSAISVLGFAIEGMPRIRRIMQHPPEDGPIWQDGFGKAS